MLYDLYGAGGGTSFPADAPGTLGRETESPDSRGKTGWWPSDPASTGHLPASRPTPLRRGWAGRRLLRSRRGKTPWKLVLASILGCVISLQLGAFSVVLETSLSGITELPFGAFLALMQMPS